MKQSPSQHGRLNISSGSVWEQQVGYSRAVRVGPHIFVTGTIAADSDGVLQQPGDPYGQTRAALMKIQDALQQAGGAFTDVVRVRLYVTNIDHWQDIARAHRELLGEVRPATTMIEVTRLFAEALVEIEVDAILTEADQ